MDEKKYIKYTTDTITDKDDLEIGKSFREMAMEAVKHAFKEGIKANSIIINKDFVRVKKAWINNGFSYSELPDMICGLEVYLTDDELPDNYSFAVVEKPQTERERLIKKTKSDTAREIYKELFEKQTEVYNKYVFKNDDYDDLETNAIINFSDSLSYEFEKYFKEKYGVDLGE
jgi:hypothetical protein